MTPAGALRFSFKKACLDEIVKTVYNMIMIAQRINYVDQASQKLKPVDIFLPEYLGCFIDIVAS